MSALYLASKSLVDEISRLRAINAELLAFAQRVADNEGPWSGQAETVIAKAKGAKP